MSILDTARRLFPPTPKHGDLGPMDDEQKAKYKRASDYAAGLHQEWTERTRILALHLYLFSERESKVK